MADERYERTGLVSPRARSSCGRPRPAPPPLTSPQCSAASPACPAPRVPPATTGVPRSRRKAIGACASTPVLSSPWGASLLAPAASGAGLRSLSKDAPLPNFPASLGLHPLVGDYSALPRHYLPKDYAADTGELHIKRTVWAEFMS